MEKVAEVVVDSRQEWVAPELKKLDVEEITAASAAGANDSFGLS